MEKTISFVMKVLGQTRINGLNGPNKIGNNNDDYNQAKTNKYDIKMQELIALLKEVVTEGYTEIKNNFQVKNQFQPV